MSAMPEYISYLSPEPPAAPRSSRRHRRSQCGTQRERYLASLAGTVVGTAILACWIGGFVQRTVVGYQVTRLQAQLNGIEENNRILSARAAALADPVRLTTDAERLGMGKADPARTIYVALSVPADTNRGSSAPIHTTTIARGPNSPLQGW
jgi:hypothetical protein